MLVLRRRVHEAVVFGGGVSMSVASLEGRRTWLTFEAPGLSRPVTVTTMSVAADRACLGICSPRTVGHLPGQPGTLQVTLEEELGQPGGVDGREDAASPGDIVLMVERRRGERVAVDGLGIVLVSTEGGRAAWGIEAPTLEERVSVTVFSCSGMDARIGIDAPPAMRVYRREVWLEMQAANRGAADWTPEELASLTPAAEESTRGAAPDAAPAAEDRTLPAVDPPGADAAVDRA